MFVIAGDVVQLAGKTRRTDCREVNDIVAVQLEIDIAAEPKVRRTLVQSTATSQF